MFSVPERIRSVHRSDSGFTLTELLITIVILGILAGMVVFAVTGFTGEGKKVACETERRNVQIAAEAYYAKWGAYPTGADDITRIGALVTGGYLKEPTSTNNGYTITLSDTGVVGPALCTP